MFFDRSQYHNCSLYALAIPSLLIMPLIEELPVTQTNRVSHGWAYIPDTGVPIAAMQAGGRKRGAPRDTENKILYNNPTVKQQKATQQRLERLAEDNWSKHTVPLPARSRTKKSTQNVRRILASERQFKHWHDEQVAQLLQTGSAPVALPVAGTTPATSRRTSTAQQLPMRPPPKPSTSRIKTEPSIPSSSSPLVTTIEEAVDPLLATRGVPKLPSKRLMDALLAEPALSFDAVAAKPLEPSKRMPARHFCSVCGYWGKVKCKRCGDRTCGLMECWAGHQGTCPVPAI
jgi:zinc finger HIT domain-containing protein 1